MSITLDRWEIQTESGYLPTVASDDIPAPTIYNTAAQGEQKILVLEYASTSSVLDQQIFFNPALFGDEGLSYYPKIRPDFGWFYEVNSDTPLDTWKPMHYLNNFANRNELNYTAEVYIETGYLGFQIRLTFYMTADLNDFMNGSNFPNLSRFIFETNDECQIDVYGDEKYIRPYTYLFDPSDQSGCYTEKPTSSIPDLKITALGACDAANTIDITFQLERNGVSVDNFSTYEDTDVLVCEDYENLTDAKVFVIRVNDQDQSKDFICDNDIYEPPTTEVKPSRLLLETGDFLLLETGDKMLLEDGAGIKFVMPKEQVDPDGLYRIYAIFYDSSAPLVESCFSDEINGLGIPEIELVDVTSEWIDFYDTYSENNMKVAPQQEIINHLTIDTVNFDTNIQAKLGTTSQYKDYFQSMVVELYDETTSGSDTITQIYGRAVIKRNASGYYVEQSSNRFDVSLVENSDTNFEISTRFQMRDEDTPNLETRINERRIATPTGNNQWVGKTLEMRYVSTLDYFNASLPYQDVATYPQRVVVDSYNSAGLITGIRIEDDSANLLQRFCNDEDFCMVVETVPGVGYELMGIVSKSNKGADSTGFAVDGSGNYTVREPIDGVDIVREIDQLVNVVSGEGRMCISASELTGKDFYGFSFFIRVP